jgi:hypothetical protein
MKPVSAVRNFKKGFAGEGSSRGYTGRTLKAFADFFILFSGFGKIRFLLTVY